MLGERLYIKKKSSVYCMYGYIIISLYCAHIYIVIYLYIYNNIIIIYTRGNSVTACGKQRTDARRLLFA